MSVGGAVVLAILAWLLGAAAAAVAFGRLIKNADRESAHHQ